ncbi:MAG: DNA/RNA nuclease SfsA [Alphaproteobacteria bacterium]|nr:DNA/RNA nuclease SfsA [Alphaproteobacteria bacterium]
MRYPSRLVTGRLVERRKRFFADVVLDDGTPVTAHLANTGAMTGCWAAGAPCRLSHSDDPKRKLAWSVEQTCIDGHWILVNTARPNRIVEEALRDGRIAEVTGFAELRREAPFPGEGRADFRADRTWIEVKNATLREGSTVWFPDSVTERGARHLDALAARLDAGDRAVLLLHVGTEGGEVVRPARHVDPGFAAALDRALGKGLEVLAYRVRLSETEATLGERMAFRPA